MTTMARQALLVLCVVMGLSTTVLSVDLTPLSEDFETITEDLIPCGGRCVVENYSKVVDAYNKCITSNTGATTEVTKYLTDNNLNGSPTYQQVYNALFKEGNSPLCGWYKKYGGTLEDDLGKICGAGVKTALKKLMADFNTFICITSPNYLACVTHPSLLDFTTISPYVICTRSLLPVFQTITPTNYYSDLILKNNGDTLFNSLRTFGTCIGTAIKTVSIRSSPPTGCTTAGDNVEKYIVDAIDYFDFGSQGKDYLKCFSYGTLHTKLTTCGLVLVTDLDATLPGGTSDIFTELEAALKKGDTSALKGPYNSLSTCVKKATKDACPADTDSTALVDKLLLQLDRFFDDDTTNDNPSCKGNTRTSPSLELIAAGLLVLLSVIMKRQ